MAFPNHHVEVFHRLVPTSLYAIGDNIDVSRVISPRFSRGITSFLVVAVGFSLPLTYFPFVVGPLLLFGVLLPTTVVAALEPQPLGITAFQLLLLSMVPYRRPLVSH